MPPSTLPLVIVDGLVLFPFAHSTVCHNGSVLRAGTTAEKRLRASAMLALTKLMIVRCVALFCACLLCAARAFRCALQLLWAVGHIAGGCCPLVPESAAHPLHLPAQVDSTFCELNPCGRGTNLQLLFTLLNTKPAAPRPAASEEGCAGAATCDGACLVQVQQGLLINTLSALTPPGTRT